MAIFRRGKRRDRAILALSRTYGWVDLATHRDAEKIVQRIVAEDAGEMVVENYYRTSPEGAPKGAPKSVEWVQTYASVRWRWWKDGRLVVGIGISGCTKRVGVREPEEWEQEWVGRFLRGWGHDSTAAEDWQEELTRCEVVQEAVGA